MKKKKPINLKHVWLFETTMVATIFGAGYAYATGSYLFSLGMIAGAVIVYTELVKTVTRNELHAFWTKKGWKTTKKELRSIFS